MSWRLLPVILPADAPEKAAEKQVMWETQIYFLSFGFDLVQPQAL